MKSNLHTTRQTKRRPSRKLVRPAGTVTVGDWQLVTQLGRGSSSRVYSARPAAASDDLPTDYAVKVLEASLCHDDDAHRRFCREAKIGATVSHPHTMPILSSQLCQPPYYQVLPMIRGITIGQMLQSPYRPQVPLCLWIARQIADGLAALHQAGWRHMDVKPDNVLVTPTGHATLFDFGLAQPIHAPSDQVHALDLHATLAYAAPELFVSARGATDNSDVYSLGVTLYQMLTGRMPFNYQTPSRLVEAHLGERAASLRTFVPHLPTELAKLVDRMLCKEPARRPTLDGDLQDALARLEIQTFAMRASDAGLRPPARRDLRPGRQSAIVVSEVSL